MKRLLAIVVLMLVITCLAFGQQQTAPPPKPGPEVINYTQPVLLAEVAIMLWLTIMGAKERRLAATS